GAADRAAERERRGVTGADRGAPLVAAGQPGTDAVEAGRREPGDRRPPDLVPVAAQHPGAAQTVVFGEGELDAVLARRDRRGRLDRVALFAVEVVHVAGPPVEDVQRPAAEGGAHRDQDAVGRTG